MIERRAIDPSPVAARALVAGAVAAVFPDRPAPPSGWQQVVERGLATGQGGEHLEVCLSDIAWIDLDLGWWTDCLGRKHWLARAEGEQGHCDPPRGGPPWGEPVCWIAPPGTAGLLARGGRREVVVVCRCGVVGTPEAVLWAGDRCGPCHDREQDGSPPPGPPVTRGHSTRGERYFLLRDGRFLARTPREGRTRALRLWAVDGPAPIWEAVSEGTVFAENGGTARRDARGRPCRPAGAG